MDLRRASASTAETPSTTGLDSGGATSSNASGSWWVVGLLALIVLVGAALRFYGLDTKTMTHTEAIIPNLVWPPDSWPPTRVSFYETFWWHFHGEGHPQAHYFLMWAWTKVFGTSLFSLRAPSALFGVGSLLLVFTLGRMTYGRRVGLLAAGLLAFHGLHIYFSQYSRMFMMASFVSLLSTVLLLQVIRKRKRRLIWEGSYVLVTWIGIYSLTFVWTILGTQVIWTLLQRKLSGTRVQRVLALQMLVVMVGSPSLAHIVYRGDDVTLPGPSLSFLGEYLSFGFALQPDIWSIPPRSVSPAIAVLLLVFAVSLVVIGGWTSGRKGIANVDGRPLSFGGSVLVATGSALVIFGLTMVAQRHQVAMAVVILVPFVAVWVPGVGRRVHRWLHLERRWFRGGWRGRMLSTPASINLLMMVVPVLVIGALSFWTSMLTSRAFLVFVPFLLLVVATGTMRLARPGGRVLATAAVAVLLGVHVASAAHWHQYPSEQFDYAGLATRMGEHMRPGDLVFVPPELWVVTPLYYYLGEYGPRYVTRDYDDVTTGAPGERVWLLHFDSVQWGEYNVVSDEMLEAISGYRQALEVEALRAQARLMVPPGAEAAGR